MWNMMTVVQLKEELKKRKASVVGKKAVLIERLEAYERNLNFGAEDVQEDEEFPIPEAEKFRDINANSYLPELTKYHIQAFVERFKAQFKGRELYESRFLLTARAAVEGDFTYVQGQCKAQMKKLFYLVNIKLNADGSIEQSHCECAAGSGLEAHCKHVMVLLHGIEDMVRTKTIILHQVCTQKLMDFKHPRKLFYNSPMKAHKLPNKRNRNVNFMPLEETDIIPNYNDHVKNLAISYGNTTMPILQTIRPANVYAIENDHNYLNKTSKDLILEDLLLKNPSTQIINEIEYKTRLQSKSSEWVKYRTCRITASNFHTVVHSKPITQKYLANKLMHPKPFVSRSTTHGQIQESVAIQKYMDLFQLDVRPCGLFISHSHSFLGATPDGLLGEDTIIEVKCPYVARNFEVTPLTVPYLEEVNGQLFLKKKHPYYYQIQGQLFCTGRKYCNLLVYTFVSLKVVFVSRDEPFISNMIPVLENFYQNHFENALMEELLYKNYGQLKPK